MKTFLTYKALPLNETGVIVGTDIKVADRGRQCVRLIVLSDSAQAKQLHRAGYLFSSYTICGRRC